MTRTIAALLAAASIVGVAVPAAAQTKYYARERIVGMPISAATPPADTTPAVTYVPTYSTTYGACSGGTKSYALTSCKTSTGTAAALSDCASFPQTKGSTSCSQYSVCGTLAGNSGPKSGAGAYMIPGGVSTAAGAQSACSSYLTSSKITDPGVCYFVTGDANNAYNNTAVWIKGTTVTSPYGNETGYFAGTCSQ